MKRTPLLLITTSCLLLLLFSACSHPDTQRSPASASTDPSKGNDPSKRDNLSKEDACSKGDDEIVMAILYQQQAAEYRALCLQSYGFARQRITEAVTKYKKGHDTTRLAVVTDLDETALDNSSNEAWSYLHDSSYTPAQFDNWILMGKAGPVPGSIAFFNYVDQQKDRHGRKIIDIYYVSNRKDSLPIIQATMNNMTNLGFPQIRQDHFLFDPSKDPSKESRRAAIRHNHNIVLLLGDNLADFDAAFDNSMGDPEERLKKVDSLESKFGSRYIVFPNAEYGDWEGTLYKGHYSNLKEKRKKRRESLHSW